MDGIWNDFDDGIMFFFPYFGLYPSFVPLKCLKSS
jgi:hypothetical protein